MTEIRPATEDDVPGIAAITPNNYLIAGSRRYRTCDIRRPTVKPPKI